MVLSVLESHVESKVTAVGIIVSDNGTIYVRETPQMKLSYSLHASIRPAESDLTAAFRAVTFLLNPDHRMDDAVRSADLRFMGRLPNSDGLTTFYQATPYPHMPQLKDLIPYSQQELHKVQLLSDWRLDPSFKLILPFVQHD